MSSRFKLVWTGEKFEAFGLNDSFMFDSFMFDSFMLDWYRSLVVRLFVGELGSFPICPYFPLISNSPVTLVRWLVITPLIVTTDFFFLGLILRTSPENTLSEFPFG